MKSVFPPLVILVILVSGIYTHIYAGVRARDIARELCMVAEPGRTTAEYDEYYREEVRKAGTGTSIFT